jgi:hypothetical protein
MKYTSRGPHRGRSRQPRRMSTRFPFGDLRAHDGRCRLLSLNLRQSEGAAHGQMALTNVIMPTPRRYLTARETITHGWLQFKVEHAG